MSVQSTTAYDTTPPLGYPGALADSGPSRTKTVLAAVIIVAGLLVIRMDGVGKGYLPTAPDAADPDAIIATGASTAGVQNLSGVALNGAIGGDEMIPSRNLVLVLSSHANWDLTTATVTGTDADGNVIQEDFVIPDAGNVTVTGVKHFATVTNLRIPAQAGTSGTFTLGTGSLLGPITGRAAHGVALYDATREPEAYPVGYGVPVVQQGRVFVTSETTYDDGDPVYVRLIAAGAEVAGQFRATPDANDCALVRGARFVLPPGRTGSIGVAEIELLLS
jgi:hypothetical protein